MRAEAEQLVLGEQGRQLGEWPQGTQAAARSPVRDMNGCANSPGFTLCCIRRRREHILIKEKKPVLNRPHLEAGQGTLWAAGKRGVSWGKQLRLN